MWPRFGFVKCIKPRVGGGLITDAKYIDRWQKGCSRHECANQRGAGGRVKRPQLSSPGEKKSVGRKTIQMWSGEAQSQSEAYGLPATRPHIRRSGKPPSCEPRQGPAKLRRVAALSWISQRKTNAETARKGTVRQDTSAEKRRKK